MANRYSIPPTVARAEEEEDQVLLSKLVELLQDRAVYSWSMQHVCTSLGVSEERLRELVEKQRGQAVDPINIFYWEANDVYFVGLESRRIDYKEDAKNGTNHIVAELINGARGDAAREAAQAEVKMWREEEEQAKAVRR